MIRSLIVATRSVAWLLALFCVTPLAAGEPLAAADEPLTASEPLTFEKHIRPILRAHCFDCHGATEDLQGGLDLRQVRLMQKGGDSGSSLSPGSVADSYLMDRVVSGEMPPGDSQLSAAELQTLSAWIEQGAKTAREEPENIPPGLGLTPEEREFWFFQPVQNPPVPDIKDPRADRARNAIDAFLLSAMPDGLSFSVDADRPTLVRRAYLILTGLPPTLNEIQRWANDGSGDWYQRLVEEVLASPHYGERWGRHWLDIAGYADSEGYSVADAERPWAWKYRDYVIRSFNQDKPFDVFLTEQIAGDELASRLKDNSADNDDMTAQEIELLTATGFLRMAADGTGSGSNDEVARNQVVNDTIKIISSSLLGLTVACAQCHDHRYDPIPQTDYYALRSVFEPALDWKSWKVPSQRLVSLYTAADRQQAAAVEAEAQTIAKQRAAKQAEYMQQALQKELMKYEQPLKTELQQAYNTAVDKRTEQQKDLLAKHPSVNISPGVLYQYLPEAAEDLKKLDSQIAEIRSKKPVEEFLRILTEPAGHAPQAVLFHRGDFQQPRNAVAPAALTVACPEDALVTFPVQDESLPTTGRRLAFAQWLTSKSNPLTARVLVNRLWLHHFGRGIVTTPSDFGVLGSRPSHPELLDWLANEFIRSGYSVKHMHRLILTSTAWRQSTQRTAAHEQLDPDNRWFSRRQLQRLDAEIVRDRMLAVSGRLDSQLFGVPVPITEDDAGQVLVDSSHTRRSLYIKMRRSQPVAMLQAFDAPVMETNCELRPVSTVATQALMLMNSQTVLNHARDLAERCRREPAAIPDQIKQRLPDVPVTATAAWKYGYGKFNADTMCVEQFTEFPHWTGSAWQGSEHLPDAAIGYAFLRADGGHPDTAERAVIRRWMIPHSGQVSLSGTLSHGSSNGDGVRARVVSTRSGLLGEWVAFNGSTTTAMTSADVMAGDIVDLVVDCQETHTSDSFTWTAALTIDTSSSDASQPTTSVTLNTTRCFHGPLTTPENLPGQVVRAWQLAYGREASPQELHQSMLFIARQIEAINETQPELPDGQDAFQTSMINLCHALITSNEFLYID